MNWIARKERMPPEGVQILVFSPNYPEGNSMRFRTLDSQFYQMTTDASHWTVLEAPKVE